MSRIRSKDTKAERLLRKSLWHAGVRFRKNYRALPGCPDIVIRKHRIAIFVDGEFWHGREWETKRPEIKNNTTFWITKIERNIARDLFVNQQLRAMGYTVVRFWDSRVEKNPGGCLYEILKLVEEKMLY